MKYQGLAAIAFTCLFSNAFASDISYKYIDGYLTTNDVDGADSTIGIKGSFDITPNVNVLGSFSTTGIDNNISGVDSDINAFSIGLGFHKEINENTDGFADINYIDQDLDLSSGSASATLASANGYGINAGVRHLFSEKVEGEIALNYLNIEDFTDTAFSAAGRYHFTKQLSGSLGYSTSDDADVTAALRMNF